MQAVVPARGSNRGSLPVHSNSRFHDFGVRDSSLKLFPVPDGDEPKWRNRPPLGAKVAAQLAVHTPSAPEHLGVDVMKLNLGLDPEREQQRVLRKEDHQAPKEQIDVEMGHSESWAKLTTV